VARDRNCGGNCAIDEVQLAVESALDRPIGISTANGRSAQMGLNCPQSNLTSGQNWRRPRNSHTD